MCGTPKTVEIQTEPETTRATRPNGPTPTLQKLVSVIQTTVPPCGYRLLLHLILFRKEVQQNLHLQHLLAGDVEQLSSIVLFKKKMS